MKLLSNGRRNTKDEKGVVLVKITLVRDHHSPTKGNISRSFRMGNAKVSEVADVIEEALTAEHIE